MDQYTTWKAQMVMRTRSGSAAMETMHSTLDGNLVDLIPFGKLIPIFSPKVCMKKPQINVASGRGVYSG